MRTRPQGGFIVLDLEYLVTLKIYTLSQRGRSAKGKKDFLDILSLFQVGKADPRQVQALLEQYRLSAAWQTFQQFLSEYTQVPELSLTSHAYAKLKHDIRGD